MPQAHERGDECVTTKKRHVDSTPCPSCLLCKECNLIVHEGKPTMHHGSCSKFPVVPDDHLSRAVMIHCCKDRTLSYRTRDEKVFNGRALPVFSVDTKEEAESLLTLVGCVQYERHPLMPDRPWRKVNLAKNPRLLDLPDLDEVTAILQHAHGLMKRRRA